MITIRSVWLRFKFVQVKFTRYSSTCLFYLNNSVYIKIPNIFINLAVIVNNMANLFPQIFTMHLYEVQRHI